MVSRLEETELKLELIEKRTTGGTLAEIRSWLRTKRNIKISVDKLSRRFHKWGVFCDQRKRAVRRAAKRARRAQEKPELKWLTCPQCGRYPFDSGKACKCGFKMGAR